MSAGNLGKAIGEGQSSRQRRIGKVYNRRRIDGVGKLGAGMLYCRPTADGEPVRDPIGDVWIDVDCRYVGSDRLVAPDPVALVLCLEAEGRGQREPDLQIG